MHQRWKEFASGSPRCTFCSNNLCGLLLQQSTSLCFLSDGNIGVFDADTLRLRCRVAPSAYLSQAVLTGSQSVYPLVVAAHPQEPSQFAVGLTDGTVKVIEPLESEGKWGVSPPVDNGMLNGRVASSSTANNHAADQVQR